MKIKKEHLRTMWFENEEGEKWYPEGEIDGPGDIPDGFVYSWYRKVSSMKEICYRKVSPKEVKECNHEDKYIKRTFGWIDGIVGRECMKCKGTQVCKEDEMWPEEWDAQGSREVMSGESSFPEDLVLKMANSGDYSLRESMLIAAMSCGRCINVLGNKYNVGWGYEEGSNEWKTCNTSCKFCEED